MWNSGSTTRGTDEYDADDRITTAQALTEIVRGTPTRDDCGAVYGWAYCDYCDSMGEFLNNGAFMPCDWAWLEMLDAALELAGVPIRFLKLIQSLPIPIPERSRLEPLFRILPLARRTAWARRPCHGKLMVARTSVSATRRTRPP